MILFLYGKDTFRSTEKLRKMIEKFEAERDPSRLNVVFPDISLSEKVVEEIHTAPFLADKRMVVLKHLLLGKDKATQEKMLEKVKNRGIPESTIVIFFEEEDSFSGTKTVKELFALLEKEKYAQKFDILTGQKLAKHIEDEVQSMGGQIELSAVQFLVENGKNDLWFIQSTLSQLFAYAYGRAITVKDVGIFVRERFDDNVFHLIDAVVGRQAKIAFELLSEQYEKGEDAHMVFSLIIRQFRILLLISDAIQRGIPLTDSMAKQMGLHPFVFKKSIPIAKRYSFDGLTKIYKELLSIDTKIKTGGGNAKDLLDIFIGGLFVK